MNEHTKHGDCVLLSWVSNMGWKMQSILLSGLRAPDSKTRNVKRIVRWMRGCAQNNADPSKGYMQGFIDYVGAAPVEVTRYIEEAMDELEYLPCHYVHHFADALRVLGIYHPGEHVRDFANRIHTEVAVEIFHFVPETLEQFKERHRDKRGL